MSVSLRLRQVDVKAEHFERQVTRLEQERDQWEKKYEVRDTPLRSAASLFHPPLSYRDGKITNHDVLTTIAFVRLQEAQEKYRASKAELDELVSSMEGL